MSTFILFINAGVLLEDALFLRKSLKISQYSQENTCVEYFKIFRIFAKFLQKNCEIFKNPFFTEHLRTTDSVSCKDCGIYTEIKHFLYLISSFTLDKICSIFMAV